MSITPNDLLEYAKTKSKEDSEVDIRTSISKAYYAAYHCCKSVEHHCPEINRENAGSHLSLIRRFERVPRKGFFGGTKARHIGALLGQAKDLRVTADYYLDSTVTKDDAKNQIIYAEQLSQLIEEFDAMIISKAS